jgi:hypothetical protein
MVPIRSTLVSIATALLLLSGPGMTPAFADVPTVVVQQEAESSLSMLLKNILADTNYNFERFRGVDDCDTEQVYSASRNLLGRYADAPSQNQEALRDYILANKSQCNCVRAMVGKNFDILVNTVRSDMSQVPCP